MSTTKQSTSEMVKEKELTLEDVLPFPLSEQTGVCSVCLKDFKDHYYMDFFLHSKHVNQVEKFMMNLRLLLDKTLNAYTKLMANRGTGVFWGTKPIVETIIETYKSNPFLANWIPRLAAHYDSSQKTEFRTRSIGNALFSNMTTKFRGKCGEFFREFWRHKELESDEYYLFFNLGINFEEDKEDLKKETEKGKNGEPVVDKRFVLEQAIKANDLSYKNFLSVHEIDAEHAYRKFRTWFFEVDGFVHGFHDATKELFETRFGKLKEAIAERQKTLRTPTTKPKTKTALSV